MPFKSKAQQRFMFAAENRGELPKGTAEEWAHKTKNIKKLPEHVKKSASDIADAVTKTSTAVRDFYEGGKWAPGGVEYQGVMKISSEQKTALNALLTGEKLDNSMDTWTKGGLMNRFFKNPAPKPGGVVPQVPKTAAAIADEVLRKIQKI